MTAPIQKLFQMCSKIFGTLTPERITKECLSPLIHAVNNLTADDIHFDPQEIEERDVVAQKHNQKAPVTYMKLYHGDRFTMGLFVVKSGCVLPLHDHPNMYGLLKVIHGSVKLITYTETDQEPVPASVNQTSYLHRHVKTVKRNDIYLTNEDECCVLSPNVGNIHEISAESDTAAFLDILAPPYESDSSCHYYQELCSDIAKDIRWLIEIPEPVTYWCDTIKYKGPALA